MGLTLENALQLSNRPKGRQAVYADPVRPYGSSVEWLGFEKGLNTNHVHIVPVEDSMWRAYLTSERRPDISCESMMKDDLANVCMRL